MKNSKRRKEILSKIDRQKAYGLKEAIELVKECATAKFDETVELAVRLNVDPRKADQVVRGTVSLPHGTGKKIKVLVLCKETKEQEANDAGADYVGLEEFIKKIEGGWADVDAIVATPDVMKDVGKLGRVLGPRGLMPNPKAGTVTNDVGEAVKQLKAGRIEYRVDKYGNIHAAVGKASFSVDALGENVRSIMDQIVKARPSAVKGKYVLNIALSSTMGPGVKIDVAELT
ncbi:50S ribosomal protein L1 [candidate division KSB1 bacterium]|nr:MAG: 50S ribosomal protein L1 [candidate division KSB1 bacterium]